MSHEDDDAVIILSVTLPAGCATPLDNLVAAGSYGSSREDVALHFICRALGVDPRPQLPDVPSVAAVSEAETQATPDVSSDGPPEGDTEEGAK